MNTLRPVPAFTAAALLLLGAPAFSATILQYQMGQAQPQIEDPVNTANGGDLTSASGLSMFNLSATNSYATAPVLQVNPNGGSSDSATAFSANQYFFFTLTVGSNVADLDLTGISFDIGKGGAGSPRGYGLRVDTPTTANETLKASTEVTSVRPTFQNESIPLTAFSSLQNLTAGQVVTFELAIFTPGTGNSLELDNITVTGDATVPEPGSALLAAVGGLGLFLRRRRQ